MPELTIAPASADDAPALLGVIHAAFGARRPGSTPPSALAETEDSLRAALVDGAALVARRGDDVVGTIVLTPRDATSIVFTRVSVHPDAQGQGVATAMVAAALESAAVSGARTVHLGVHPEFDELVEFWRGHGFDVLARTDGGIAMARRAPVLRRTTSGDEMQALGADVGRTLRAGDLVLLSGELGAGKTTLTQGLARGLGIEEPVLSPTFQLVREHANPSGPRLVHVDAYRLERAAELDDLDLAAALADAVVVVEWGRGLVETLAESRLEIDLWPDGDARDVRLDPIGPRWLEDR